MRDQSVGSSKARHGNEFKDIVVDLLSEFKNNGLINTVETSKNVPYELGFEPQFLIPFLVKSKYSNFALFSTTTARSDRIKINQWDSFGIKHFFKDNIKCVLVLPNNLSPSELRNFDNEVERIKEPQKVSLLDAIITIDQLKGYLSNEISKEKG